MAEYSHLKQNETRQTHSLVIDANLIIGAYWNRKSSSWDIINGCLESRWKHFYTKRIKKEVFRILKNIHANKNYLDKINSLYREGTEITKTRKINIVRDDPDDNKYLECADASSARHIVTNDRHLLELGHFEKTEIIQPKGFMRAA